MIEDLDKYMEDLIKTSRNMFINNTGRSQGWKMCRILHEAGWKCDEEVRYIEGSTDIITVWRKEGNLQEIRLTIDDQYQWVRSERDE